MTPLEQRYRQALRWFPASWRPAMLDTLLERADDEGRLEPRRGELTDLARNGLIARGRAMTSIVPAASRRLLGSAAIGAGAVYSLFVLLSTELPPPGWSPDLNGLYEQPWMFGSFFSPAALVFLLWIAAFVVLLLRWRRLGAWLLTAAVAWGVAVYPVFGAQFTVRLYPATEYSDGLTSLLPNGLSFVFVTLLALLALGDRGHLSSRRAGLVGAVIMAATIGFVALSVTVNTTLGMLSDSIFWGDQPALALVAVVLLGIGALVAVRWNRNAGIAVALASAPLAVTMAAQIIDQHDLYPSGGGLIVYTVLQVVAGGIAGMLALTHRAVARSE